MAHWIALIIAMLLNAAANVLLKIGAVSSTAATDGGTSQGLFAKVLQFINLATAAGIMLFAMNVLVYRKALDKLNISVAYPVMVSGGLVLVTLAAVLLPQLKEKITLIQLFGMVLIAVGVWLVAR